MRLSELISKNPYRVLGISGCSSQELIYKAADKAIKAAKFKIKQNGIWEEKFKMETMLFTEAQINNSLLLLNDAKERYIYRILGIMEMIDPSVPNSLRSITLNHDELVLNLINLQGNDEFIIQLLKFNKLVDNEEFIKLNSYIEDFGEFNKSEINYSIYSKYFKSIEKSLLKDYIEHIIDSEDIDVIINFNNYIEIINNDLFDEKIISTYVQKLEGFVEDNINKVLEIEFSKVKTENVTEEDRQNNLLICNSIINLYENIFNKILICVSKDYTWIPKTTKKRIIEHCVQFYQQLAINLTWADDYQNADIYIKKAISYSEDIDNCKNLEEIEKSIVQSITSIQNNKLTNARLNQKPCISKNSKSGIKFLIWTISILVVIIIGSTINNSLNSDIKSESTADNQQTTSSSDSKAELKVKIDNLHEDIVTYESNLESVKSELDALELDIDNESDIDTKNQYINEYNSKLEEYNSGYLGYEDDIDRYNTWIKEYNNEN